MATTKTDYECALAHRYRVTSGGEFVPGVTSIIGVVEKPQLMWSAAAIAAEAVIENARRKKTIVAKHREWLIASRGKTDAAIKKRTLGNMGSDNEVFAHWARGEFRRQWDAKADRGTRVHTIGEAWAKGEVIETLDEDAPWVDALEQFHRDYKPKFRLVECIVINAQYEYGGRFDFIAELDGPDAQGVFLCDYKTGGHYSFDVALQASGYMHARLATWSDDGALSGWTMLPVLDGARTIYLGDDGNVSVVNPFERIDYDDAWDAFRACRKVHAMQKKINKQLGRNDNDN